MNLIAGSTNTVTYRPLVADVLTQADTIACVVTDGDGATATLAHTPTWTTAGYVLTIDPAEVPASKIDELWTLVWTWTKDSVTLRDVEKAYVVASESSVPLATGADLSLYGYNTDAADMLARASTRARGYTGQDITSGTSTVTLGFPYLLPQRPVVSVTSVTDEAGTALTAGVDNDYTLQGQYIVAPEYKERLTVTYTHGFSTIPDRLVEVVCAIAARMHDAPAGLKKGIMADGASGEQVTFGVQAYSGVADLTPDEKAVLDGIFPHTRKVPRTAVTM